MRGDRQMRPCHAGWPVDSHLPIVFCLRAIAWLFALTCGGVVVADEFYARRIDPPRQLSADLRAATEDLRRFLGEITGGEYFVESGAGETGIVLRRADAANVPEEAVKRLAQGSKEACCVFPEEGRLWLIARSDIGLSHAVYLYLEQLGCRWYYPGENWTIIPRRDDIRLSEPIVAAPVFRSRLFAGTGGFGGKLPLDPERRNESRWNDWQRRRRFGGEFRVSGHTGEAFNQQHRAELEAHPEWRAMIDGQRVPWSITAKFCAGNPEVVGLYVRDRVEFLRRQRQLNPESPHAWAVSVEPADGGGHCQSPESVALGSVSDRVFHVANEVARAVRQEFPDGRVSLFAYNEHAAVPSIPLEPNVYVQVIPYAFQRTGLTPDQLLDAWSHKVKRMGVYDYWSIPDWSHDLPTFDPLGFGPERLRGWLRRGVDSYLCESTDSSGAMGLAWHLAARLSWTPELPVEQAFDEFLADCFGPAAPPMRRLLVRWSEGFHLTSHELALSYRDLDEAQRLAASELATLRRIADYGRYVAYLDQRLQYELAPRGEERRAAAAALMRLQWSIYDSSMIHAFRLSQLLARDEKNAGHDELATRFNWQDATAPGWADVRPLDDAEVWRQIAAGIQRWRPQDFSARRFTGALAPVPPSLSDAASYSVRTDPPQFHPEWPLANTLEFSVDCGRDGDEFPLRVGSELPVHWLVQGPDGKLVSDQTLVTGEAWRTEWTEAKVTLPRAGRYTMQVVSQKRPLRVSLPMGWPHSIPGWSNSQGAPTPRLWFYVPTGTRRLAIYANYTAAGPPRFFAPDGAEMAPEQIDGGRLLLVTVPEQHAGQIWALDRAKCPIGPLSPLNFPASFAFSPEELLVPADATQSAQAP